MHKVLIIKKEYSSYYGCNVVCEYVSIDAIKPFDISDEDWESLNEIVEGLARGEKQICNDYSVGNCNYDLHCIINDKDWGILAESEYFYIRNEYEEAYLYSKPDSRKIASVGHYYGDPETAFIDPDEKFCITIGCGIIKYNLVEPFEDYMYGRNTEQWIETGRDSNEWFNCIEKDTDSYFTVSCDGEDIKRFNLQTLDEF